MSFNKQHSTLRRHDFVLSVIVWLIALFTLIESWRLTFHLDLPGVEADKAWLVSPGILPLALSAGLLLMFSVVIWVSLKEGEFQGHFSKNAILAAVLEKDNLVQIAQVALLCLYVFGLLGRIHFGIASAIYLFAAMFAARAAKWYTIAGISIVFSMAVTYLFGTLMKIPLP